MLVLGSTCPPNFLRMWVTKSEGVIPPFAVVLTDITTDWVISRRAFASATCSLGFVTEISKTLEKLKAKFKNEKQSGVNYTAKTWGIIFFTN